MSFNFLGSKSSAAAAPPAVSPNQQFAPPPPPKDYPKSRPDSIVSAISDDGPDTSREYAPSIASDHSSVYQNRAPSPSEDGESIHEGRTGYDINNVPLNKRNTKYISPSQASDGEDASLSDIADAYRNHAILSGDTQIDGQDGRRTPKVNERGGVVYSNVTEELQDEILGLRRMLEQETVRREEMKQQFIQWREILTHNMKALIQNSKVNLHKNYMRVHPLLNDDGSYPDMAVFPTTVGALMKMNEPHLTSLIVFYGLQADQNMDYYAKYCALRDYLGIEP